MKLRRSTPLSSGDGLLRELLVHELVEDVAARQLLETAPVLLPAQVADARAELGETQCLVDRSLAQ